MKTTIYTLFASAILFFSACGGEGENATGNDNDTLQTDTTQFIDTTSINPIDTVAADSAGYIDEDAALTTQIEKVYGEQWEFCDCVVKNDSVNNAIMETEDDAEIDLILVRMEVIDQHCKEMLTTPNTTPEERAKHERKVNKCLRNAK